MALMVLPRPEQLPDQLRVRWQNVCERLESEPAVLRAVCGQPGYAVAASRVFTVSEFVLRTVLRYPEEAMRRLTAEPLSRPVSISELRQSLGFDPGDAEPGLLRQLRVFRQVELARIAWRDLAGMASIDESLAELSAVADCCIEAAADYAMAQLTSRYGQPRSSDGQAAFPVVLAMGKLGGGELNFSSDVDLIFLYSSAGTTDGEHALDNERFFLKFGQLLIRLLDSNTPDGSVYRVDTRLRPFGSAGPLAVSFSSLEGYLVQHGRDWERYAYVKARAIGVSGDPEDLFRFILEPFVYRRYLDYGVFDALRNMKGLIAQEVSRKDLADNIKLGPGGIREIEFIAQSFQLVRGGQDVTLRGRHLLDVLTQLGERGCLSPSAVAELAGAYRFLRSVENRLQALDDQQTHELPTAAEPRSCLALAMGMSGWDALRGELDGWRSRVDRHFSDLVFQGGPVGARSEAGAPERDWWALGLPVSANAALRNRGLADVDAVIERLRGLRQGSLYRRMDEPSRLRLDNFIPRLLDHLVDRDHPAVTLERLLPLIEAVGRRSAYLALLNENPRALERLVDLAQSSDFLPAQIAEQPMLLDELLDPRIFEAAPTRASLKADFAQLLSRQPDADIEQLLESMRRFQRMAMFRIAVADLSGALTIMKVSDRLTDTAELVLEFALTTARNEMTRRYGTPLCGEPGSLRPAQFCILGYGKLGGLELGYGSDLDLVFIHHGGGSVAETDGANPLDNQRFFGRLAQRLLHFLTIQTRSGRLYEVDTRLRPSGRSGLMVASLGAFARYQRREAWTWEHQALLRSRSVAGDEGLRRLFEDERREILCHHVKRETLAEEVRAMRARMRAELSKGDSSRFDIKQDAGGIADLEFLVDYWVLKHAGDWPELVTYTDNVRQLEALERVGLVPARLAQHLTEAYLSFRRRLHGLALANAGRVVDGSEFAAERALVSQTWQRTFGD